METILENFAVTTRSHQNNRTGILNNYRWPIYFSSLVDSVLLSHIIKRLTFKCYLYFLNYSWLIFIRRHLIKRCHSFPSVYILIRGLRENWEIILLGISLLYFPMPVGLLYRFWFWNSLSLDLAIRPNEYPSLDVSP